jgi:hypothetical protein
MRAARQAFEAGFRQAGTGNLYREFEGRRVTVFRDRRGEGYKWAIDGGDEAEPRFSDLYESEADATDGLWDALGGNDW